MRCWGSRNVGRNKRQRIAPFTAVQCTKELADGVGFEPTSDLRRCRFSRPVYSTALPPIRGDVDDATSSNSVIVASGPPTSQQLKLGGSGPI